MNVLIAGGSGFLGTFLANSFADDGHKVRILTRGQPNRSEEIKWDGVSTGGWSAVINDTDIVINLTGYALAHWPWTKTRKQRFRDSRVLPGQALVSAIKAASHRPRVFIQASGINWYGLRGEGVADETTPAANDFLAQLTVEWEASTAGIETLGVRRITLRQAVVLAKHGGLFPMMALPVRLFVGGPIGDGGQAVPWIHIADQVGAIRFLIDLPDAHGAYNLVAPTPTSNAEFMRSVAKALHRPYWFPPPALVLRMALGEMSVLVTEGRYGIPKRLLDLGYKFRYPTIVDALTNLFGS